MLNLLVGEEGAGKGTLIAHLLARLTQGDLDGDLHGDPCMVLILGDEDDFGRVWTPRLHVAGADFDYVRHVKGELGGALTFPSGTDTLRGFVAETGARAVFFDSLLDNLDPGIDDWRSQQVRRPLGALRALADELSFAAIGSLHTNKARGGSFRQSVQGSHAFNAVSKSSLLVAKHPDGPEERRVVARGKGNYAQRPISQEFTIAGRSPKIGDHIIQTSAAISFADCSLTADDLLAPPQRAPTSKAGRARQYIEQALSDGQAHEAKPIVEYLSTEFELDTRAIRKAREHVGAISEKRSEFQGLSTWRLPTDAEQFTRIGPIGRTEAESEAEAA